MTSDGVRVNKGRIQRSFHNQYQALELIFVLSISRPSNVKSHKSFIISNLTSLLLSRFLLRVSCSTCSLRTVRTHQLEYLNVPI